MSVATLTLGIDEHICCFSELRSGQHFTTLRADATDPAGAKKGECIDVYCKLSDFDYGRSGCNAVDVTSGGLLLFTCEQKAVKLLCLPHRSHRPYFEPR